LFSVVVVVVVVVVLCVFLILWCSLSNNQASQRFLEGESWQVMESWASQKIQI